MPRGKHNRTKTAKFSFLLSDGLDNAHVVFFYLEANEAETATSMILVGLSVSTTNSFTTALGVPGCTWKRMQNGAVTRNGCVHLAGTSSIFGRVFNKWEEFGTK